MIILAFTESEVLPNTWIVHKQDCPVVEQHRRDGRMVCTIVFKTPPSPLDAPRHECLKNGR